MWPTESELGQKLIGRPPKFIAAAEDAVVCHRSFVAQMALLEAQMKAVPDLGRRLGMRAIDVDDWHRHGSACDVFWFTKNTSRAIASASASYPIEPPIYMPTIGKAFAVFEESTLGCAIESFNAPFSALMWVNAYRERTLKPSIEIVGLQWRPPVCTPVWWSSIEHPTTPVLPSDPTFDDEKTTLLRFVLSASMFIEQRIAIPERAVVSRQVRRSLARAGIPETCVNVVNLRKVWNHNDGSIQGTQEWSCQWLVGGHWRRQWYPKAGRHVRRWIAPYIKGPEDKPLKAPAPTVFAVTR